MYFDWDPKKAKANIKKHGVSFELAVTVFSDPHHLSVIESSTGPEERWVTIGHSPAKSTLIVIHTYLIIRGKEELIRIISARKATRKEKKQYEEGI